MPTAITGFPAGNQATINGADITVSALLNQPRILDRRLAGALQDIYWADRILPNVGATSGGVIIAEQWDPSLAFLDRKVEDLAPDTEVPLAGASVGEPIIARAQPRGLGYTVTREQEERNQPFVLDRKELGLANSLADAFNAKAVDVVLAAIATYSRTFPVATPWEDVVVEGATPTSSAARPLYTLQTVKANQRVQRIPFGYDVMIASPLDLLELSRIYPQDNISVQVPSRSATLGLDLIPDTTGKVPHGAPILVASEGAGGTATEQPLLTEVIPEPRRRRRVVQATASLAYFIDNPQGVLQLTGTWTA
jgi:hypothetical protein